MIRTVVAGLAGGVALNLSMLLTFRLLGFGWDGNGILLDPRIQNPKLIAVWTTLSPLPRILEEPGWLAGLMLFGIGHALLYRALSPAWRGGRWSRSFRLGGWIFALTFLFWEFFTPFNLFGEPLPLIGLELLFWGLTAFGEAAAIVSAYQPGIPWDREMS